MGEGEEQKVFQSLMSQALLPSSRSCEVEEADGRQGRGPCSWKHRAPPAPITWSTVIVSTGLPSLMAGLVMSVTIACLTGASAAIAALDAGHLTSSSHRLYF